MGPIYQEESAEAPTRNGGAIPNLEGNHNLKAALDINVLVDPVRERRRLPMEERKLLPCGPHLVYRTTGYAQAFGTRPHIANVSPVIRWDYLNGVHRREVTREINRADYTSSWPTTGTHKRLAQYPGMARIHIRVHG
jgi:hypothetical protein